MAVVIAQMLNGNHPTIQSAIPLGIRCESLFTSNSFSLSATILQQSTPLLRPSLRQILTLFFHLTPGLPSGIFPSTSVITFCLNLFLAHAFICLAENHVE